MTPYPLLMYSEHSAAIAAPPHRRRRPPLACVLCRRRKIKCDQKTPCSQCERSKDAVCMYGADIKTSLSHGTQKLQDTLQHPGERNVPLPTPESSDAAASVLHTTPVAGLSKLSDSSFAGGNITLPKGPVIDDLRTFGDPSSKDNTLNHYAVYAPDIERHVMPSGVVSNVGKSERPLRFKMKLIGDTHWMNLIMQFDRIMVCIFDSQRGNDPENSSELKTLLLQCKELGRAMKSKRSLTCLAVPDLTSNIPSKKICDEFVGNYLRTFESIYRVIHIPSFLRKYDDYWNNSSIGNYRYSPFMPQFLLVLAIGSTLQSDASGKPSYCSTAREWIYTAQQWFSAPFEKSRMNITGIQIQCLLLLAREAVGIGSELLWISAGSLLRSAMQLGYHRDPKHYPGMSILHAEMRRRLWATILELGVKESLSTAMPPLVSMNDFDTVPPANINDADISQDTTNPLISRDLSTFTQTTLQIIMLQSLQDRLELASIMTDFHSQLSYEEVLRLHSKLTSACRKARSFVSDNQSLTPFQCNYFNFTTLRPLLSLHIPWAAKARNDPRFYFSCKVCLDTCLTMLSPSPSVDYSRLLTVGNGIWLEIGSLPPLAIAFELIMQLEEEALNPLAALQATRAKASREPLIQVLRDAVSLKVERLRAGEMNVKGYLVTRMTLGQIEAMEKGEDIEKGIAEAAMNSLRESHAILKERASKFPKTGDETGVSVDWENQDYEAMGDGFDFDSLMDAGFDFDMTNTGPVGEFDYHF